MPEARCRVAMKRSSRVLMAGLASVGGAIAAAGFQQTHRLRQGERLGVTLYGKPHYRGAHETLAFDPNGSNIRPLSATRLTRVGSIRVQRFVNTFRPALDAPEMLWSSVADRTSSEHPTLLRLIAVHRFLDPESWQVVREPSGDKQSWVRLWAERPTHPLPQRDESAAPDEQPWFDVLVDTPDLGPWRNRARYLELGIRNPHPPRSR